MERSGIPIYYEWKKNPSAFECWTLHSSYKKFFNLNIIYLNGEYSPDNCIWQVPVHKKNKTRYLTYKSDTLSVSDWAKRIGLSKQGLFSRLVNGQWKKL